MLSSIFFINVTFNSICWYHKAFTFISKLSNIKLEIFIENIFDLFDLLHTPILIF